MSINSGKRMMAYEIANMMMERYKKLDNYRFELEQNGQMGDDDWLRTVTERQTMLRLSLEIRCKVVETIMGVALRWQGVVYKLPAPRRHGDVIQLMRTEHGHGPECMHEQGFYTNREEFIDRQEAWEIARYGKQILPKPPVPGTLFSEDVW
jgi:hypothetical protein